MTHIDVIIPARNESAALPRVIGDLPADIIRQVVVVDNGSNDGTGALAQELGCLVVACPIPGYGRACLAGIDALARDPPDIVVFLDGDHSDYPQEMTSIIAPIRDGGFDLVIGSRALGVAEQGSLTPVQRFGNWLATRLMAFFWSATYTDLGPFRGIAWDSLKKLNMSDKDYGWTIEMQIKAVTAGLRCREVPVSYRNRIGRSKVSGTISGSIKAGSKILWTIFRYRFSTARPRV